MFPLLGGLVLCATVTSASADQVSREQDIVNLRLGQRVKVDDGTCPAGQVKNNCYLATHQLPYLPTIACQTALRSLAKGSLPTLAFFATAVTTMTSLSSGSTKIDWP
jgi:hypothetical protein